MSIQQFQGVSSMRSFGQLVDKNGMPTDALLAWMTKVERTVTQLGVTAKAVTVPTRIKNIDAGGVIESAGIDLSRIYENQTLKYVPDGGSRFAVVNAGALNGVSAVDPANRALIDFSQAGHQYKDLANIADDPLGTWRRVAGVNSANQATSAALAAASVNQLGYATFSLAAITGTVSDVASFTMPVGTAANDSVYFGVNFSNITSDFGSNFFVFLEVFYAGAAGSTVVQVDYLYNQVFGALILPASASVGTTATLSVALANGTAGTASGTFWATNQQQR